jgi:hypothetical protein
MSIANFWIEWCLLWGTSSFMKHRQNENEWHLQYARSCIECDFSSRRTVKKRVLETRKPRYPEALRCFAHGKSKTDRYLSSCRVEKRQWGLVSYPGMASLNWGWFILCNSLSVSHEHIWEVENGSSLLDTIDNHSFASISRWFTGQSHLVKLPRILSRPDCQ